VKRLTAQDWYDVADLFGTAAVQAEETGGYNGLNSDLAHAKAAKMMSDMAKKAHDRGQRIEMEEKAKSYGF
jgi:hypothetical protein